MRQAIFDTPLQPADAPDEQLDLPPDRIFAGPRHGIAVAGAEAVAEELAVILSDWPWQALSGADSSRKSDLHLQKLSKTWQLLGGRLPAGLPAFGSAFEAADTLSGALVLYFMAQSDAYFQIHASGAVLDGGVVAFLGDSMAGKSSLALHLAALGQCIYSDDRLLLRATDAEAAQGQAVCQCLGLAPAMRLPLPADAGADFGQFIESRQSLVQPESCLLALRAGEMASHGATAPLKALVLLDRRADAELALEGGGQVNTIQAALSRSMAPHLAPQVLLRRVARLARQVPCYSLSYRSSREAAHLIVDKLGQA